MGPSKESTCKAGEVGSIPGLGRFRGEGNSYYSIILAWRIPWTVTVGGLQSMGLQELDMTERLTFTFSLSRGQMDTIAKKIHMVAWEPTCWSSLARSKQGSENSHFQITGPCRNAAKGSIPVQSRKRRRKGKRC